MNIQPGDEIGIALETNIETAALIAIRTDRYIASPWCRQELDLAKRYRRPIVIVDALHTSEARSSTLLANLPSVRLGGGEGKENFSEVTNFVGLEVLRFLFAAKQLALLKNQRLADQDTILLARPPEARDISKILSTAESTGQGLGQTVFVYPDPVIGPEEAAELEAFGAKLVTPSGVWGDVLNGLRLGLSIGTNPTNAQWERAAGLSGLHLADAATSIARQALSTGADIVYGGTLEVREESTKSLTYSLAEMLAHYRRAGSADFPPIQNFIAWPFAEKVTSQILLKHKDDLRVVQLDPPQVAVDADMDELKMKDLVATPKGRAIIGLSLSEMRRKIVGLTHARIVLGGAAHKVSRIASGYRRGGSFGDARRPTTLRAWWLRRRCESRR